MFIFLMKEVMSFRCKLEDLKLYSLIYSNCKSSNAALLESNRQKQNANTSPFQMQNCHLDSKVYFVVALPFFLTVVNMTQTRHHALDPNCAEIEAKYTLSPGGNRPSAVFCIHHTITKLIFDSDWYSHFLSPATA